MQMISEEQLQKLTDLNSFRLRFNSPANDLVVGSSVSVLNSDPENPILGDAMIGRTGNDIFLGVDPASDTPGLGEIDLLIGGFEETIEETDGVGTSVNPDRDQFRLGDGNSVYYSGLGPEDYAIIVDFDSAEDVIQLNGSADDYVLTEIDVSSLFSVFPDFSGSETVAQEMEARLQVIGITTVTAILRGDPADAFDETSISLDDPAYDLIGIVAGDLDLNLGESYFKFVNTPPSADPVLPQIEQFGTSGIEFGYGVAADGGGDIAVDSNGNVYQVGGTSRDLAAPNAGGNDVLVAKFSDNGNQMFIEQFGSPTPETAFSVAIDSNDNVFTSGVAVGEFAGLAFGGNDAWVAKLDEDSNVVWKKQFGTSERDNSFGSSLAVDTSDNVIQGGYTLGDLAGPNAGEGPDAWVVKFDNDGNELWRRQFGTPEFDELFGVTTDSDDNIFLTGWTIGDLGGNNAGLYDTWIAKYDSDGNQLWTTQFGTSDYDFSRGAAIDSEGNFYTTGFTLGDLGGPNAGVYDTWVVKYDTNGNQLWIEQFGTARSDTSYTIDINDNDEIFVGGYTDGSLGRQSANAVGEDSWVAKLDSDGNLLDVVQFGTAENDRTLDLSPGHNNDIFVSGYTEGSLGASNAGAVDTWLAQLSATDLDLVSTSELDDTYKVLESYTVDFETTASGDQLLAGTSITNQYDSFSGLTISTPQDEFGAMIFDSANPTDGDFDLATEDRGNVLIISQDGDSSDPNDKAGGGTIRFQWSDSVFVDSVLVNSIGLLDIDEAGGSIIAYDDDGDVLRTVDIPDFGDNSLGQVDINTADVAYLDVNLFGSGAITEVSFNSLSENE